MSVTIIVGLQQELRRLSVAGSDIAAGDSRMRRLSTDIRKIGEAVPVFARLADSIESLTNPGTDSSAGKLLEAATLTNALLYTQGVTGIKGEIGTNENSSPDLPTAASYQTISRVKEAMEERGGSRLDLFEKVCEEGKFVDLRLLDTFLELLYSPSNDVANLVCEKILPSYGEIILPQLINGYKVKGKVGDGRRLELIARILKEKGEDMYLDALKHGSEGVKVGALKCLKYVPESTDMIIEYSRSKNENIRVAAFKMLAETNSEAAADRIIEVLGDYYWVLSNSISYSPLLTRRLIEEGDACLACYQQKKVDDKMNSKLETILAIFRESDSAEVREFFKRCKGQPDCLIKIAVGSLEHKIDIEDPDDRKNLLSALRSIVHSSFEHGTKGLPHLTCLTAHAAILEDDQEAVNLIVRFASDPSSPIHRNFTHSINSYTYNQLARLVSYKPSLTSSSFTYSIDDDTHQQLMKKADFPVTRRLFEIALDIATTQSSASTNSMSLFCNALWVMRKDNTGLPVDREMNEKFLEKCLPYGPKNPAIYFNAACLHVEMDEYDKALEYIGLLKKHKYRGYDGMMEQIRTLPMFADFRKDERVIKIIEI